MISRSELRYHISHPKVYVSFVIGLALALTPVWGFAVAMYGARMFIMAVGILLVALMWFQPELTFALYWISMLALGPGFPLIWIGPVQVNVMDLILAIGVARLVSARLMSRQAVGRPSRASVSFLMFFLMACVVGLWRNPLELVARDARPFFYLGMTWLWVSLLAKRWDADRLLVISLSLGSVLALVKTLLTNVSLLPLGTLSPNLLQAYSVFSPTLGASRTLLFGANTLLPVGIPMFLSYLIYGGALHRTLRMLLWGGLVSAAAVLFLGFSRAAWLGSMLGVVLVAWLGTKQAPRYSRIRTILLLLILLVLILAVASIVVRSTSSLSAIELILNRFSGDYDVGGSFGGLVNYRRRETQEMWRSLRQSPLTGEGFGGTFLFQDFGYRYMRELTWTHVGWSWLLLKGGLVGLVLFLYPFLSLARRVWYELGKEDSTALVTGLLAAGTALALMGLSRNAFSSPEGGAFLGAWLGLLAVVSRGKKTKLLEV